MGKIWLVEMNERIEAARRHSGLSMQVFANRIGVTREAVRLWLLPKEHPKHTSPRDDHIDKICDIAGVNKAWLVSGVGPMIGGDPQRLTVTEISEAIRHLPLADRMAAISRAFHDLQKDGLEPPER